MSRSICILLVAALFVFAQGSELQRLALNQGRVNFRSLAAAADSTEKVAFDRYGEGFGVFVNLGEEYLSNNSLSLKNQTDMTVVLHSNVTSFCRSCTEFVNFNCSTYNNSCNADKTVELTVQSPFRTFRSNPFNQSVSIGNTTNPSWKLSTNATVFSGFASTSYYYTSYGYSRSYLTNYSTYGLLGLGVGGGAASNFKGDHPLFSVSLNSTGYGSLIFGKDATLYDASKTPMTLTADTNWTMVTKNLTFGSNYSNSSFASSLVFDLQYPGIAIPKKYWSDSRNDQDFYKMFQKLNLSSSTEDGYYTFYGNLTDLPDLVFGLENGKNLTIPPAGYTRKSASRNNTLVILIGYYIPITNISDSDSNEAQYTVLGWPVLSQFYTIFEQKTESEPTITLYPAKASSNSGDNTNTNGSTSLGTRAIQLIVVVVLLAVVYTCFKNRAAAKLQNDLGEQLNRKASAF